MVHMDHHTLASLAVVVREALDDATLSDREVERLTGIPRTTLVRRLADGDFKFSELVRLASVITVPTWQLVKRAEEPAA